MPREVLFEVLVENDTKQSHFIKQGQEIQGQYAVFCP